MPENEIELTFGAAADDPPTTVALRLEFQRDRLSQQSPEEVLYIYVVWNVPWEKNVNIPPSLLNYYLYDQNLNVVLQ